MEIPSITPQLLHKDTKEDILLSSVEPVLPARLPQERWIDLETLISDEERTLLETAYHQESSGLVLRGLSTLITADEASQINNFEIDLATFYTLNKEGWRLKASLLPFGVLNRLTNGQGLQQILNAQQATRLQGVFAEWLSPPQAPTLSYLVHNDTANYFFYRKQHEHVPGLMLIEVARQAMYHYFYTYSGYNRGEVSISISNLKVDFNNYVESAYELEVLVCQSEGLARRCPRSVDKTARFFQNGREVAKIRLLGTVMKMPLFKRLRTLQLLEGHWFSLSTRILKHALLSDATGRAHSATIKQLSMNAARLVMEAIHTNMVSLSFYVQQQGFVVLPLTDNITRHNDELIELEFAKLNSIQRYALQEVIKCHCFHINNNEAVTLAKEELLGRIAL